MTGFYTAPGDTVTIPLMKGISPELMQVNTNDDIARWWEVMDQMCIRDSCRMDS